MIKFFRLFRLKIHRLVGYVWMRLSGVKLNLTVRIIGLPVIKKANGAIIEIGDHSDLRSLSKYTAMGVPKPVVLNAMFEGAAILIGKRVGMSGVTICAKTRVSIEDGVMLGSGAIIADTDFHCLDHEVRGTDVDFMMAKSSPIHIGANSFVGANSMILKGVSIGARSVVAAGAIVTKDVPPDVIVAGNPAKIIKKINE